MDDESSIISPPIAGPLNQIQTQLHLNMKIFGDAIGNLQQRSKKVDFGAEVDADQKKLIQVYIDDMKKSFTQIYDLIDELPDVEPHIIPDIERNNAEMKNLVDTVWKDDGNGRRRLVLDDKIAAAERLKDLLLESLVG
ncbi:hypothetical protein J8273_4016 [Carpediemonas membranifera]|uniref:Uncharacterized protein n=1 Tax=Carpediemonas membranifera TaxID=201153 RepID=A0A8J6E4F0_9EUKA|nr:hypothetical protein J8273_4016 [Carpediemonas membranifera]|eukprot:KAG9394372.1 hypothetical protein J8273_4016 [Carpediemonas membranifera]